MLVELVATNTSDSRSLEAFPAVMGQGAAVPVQLDDSNPGNYHCLVSVVESQLVVWDLGTTGGTFVNGTRVTRAAIKPGDTLKLGMMEFQVNYQPRYRRYLHGVRS